MKRGRLGIVIVLIVSLIGAAVMRSAAASWQESQSRQLSGQSGNGLGGAIGGMSSFAIALVLGGLRGPLVMFLWATSESQKADRDLQDFDTKVEWIRLLQPEFDTVHIFQIWNKAYNISVLMASPANKYVTIMEALEYGRSIDREKPGDLNILAAVSQVYTNKLDGPSTQERPFYNRQFQLETMSDTARKIAYPDETGFRPLRKDGVLLDDSNHLLKKYVEPDKYRRPREPGQKEWNDGSDLQYLKTYEPFPYGVPPVAVGWNYTKRAQVALTAEGQKSLNLSGMVIDSRPGVELKQWADEEMGKGRNFEDKAFNISTIARPDADDKQAAVSPSEVAQDARALEIAIYSYGMAARLVTDARVEYERHLAQPEYVNRFRTYEAHLDDVDFTASLAHADHDYLAARVAAPEERSGLLRSAAVSYQKARVLAERLMLRYYTEDEILVRALPPHSSKRVIGELPPEQLDAVFAQAMKLVSTLQNGQYDQERALYLRGVARAERRLQFMNTSPLRAPTAIEPVKPLTPPQ